MDFSQITYYILTAAAALIALTIHEVSHGYVAYKLGDNTAMSLGRLSLNPLKHIDIYGVICTVLFHFGWAKPVPINARNFKKPKRDFALTALAGPASNLILAFIMTAPFLLCLKLYLSLITSSASGFVLSLLENTISFLSTFVMINIGLGVFNLIPIPPFDGSRILNVILPERIYFKIMKYEKKIYIGVVCWLLLGGYVFLALMSVPFIASSPVLSFIARFFSLSELLSGVNVFLLELIMDFWQLIIPI